MNEMNEEVILGLDAGNSYYKTSKGIVLRARIKFNTEGDGLLKSNTHLVKKDGLSHLVGDPEGKTYTNPDKYATTHFDLCTLTSIALSFPNCKDIKVKLVVGTPAGYYKQHATLYLEKLRTMGAQTINIGDGRGNINIEITDSICYIQSGITDSQKEKFDYPLLVLDFGGGTLDASLWRKGDDINPENTEVILDSKVSYTQFGFDQILEQMTTTFNSKNGTKFKPHELLQYLKRSEITLRKQSYDLQKTKDEILIDYIDNVISSLGQTFDLQQALETCVMGGPAEILLPYLNIKLDNTAKLSSEHPQLTNALAYLDGGKQYWDLDE